MEWLQCTPGGVTPSFSTAPPSSPPSSTPPVGGPAPRGMTCLPPPTRTTPTSSAPPQGGTSRVLRSRCDQVCLKPTATFRMRLKLATKSLSARLRLFTAGLWMCLKLTVSLGACQKPTSILRVCLEYVRNQLQAFGCAWSMSETNFKPSGVL